MRPRRSTAFWARTSDVRSARCLAIVLVTLVSLPLAAQQKVDWADLYRQAIGHVQRREWKPAEDKLLVAMKAGPKSGRGVIRRFMDRDDYFPEFYLGVVYLNTNRVGAALVQFELARKNDVNTRAGDFRQLADLEKRARSILEADSRKAETEKPNPSAQFKTFMDRAQRAFSEGRYDEAEGAARQARDLNVDNAAADTFVQNVERAKHSAALQQELAKSPSLAELRRLRTEYEGKGVSLDEVIRLIAAGEAIEARARGERTGMIEFYAGNYQKSIAAIAEAEKAAPLSARGHFYRACSLASLATRGKTVSQTQLREARRAYAQAAEQADQFKNDLRFVSPRLIQLLKGS
jgi:tetratricopeptide (TPR) repeat protein